MHDHVMSPVRKPLRARWKSLVRQTFQRWARGGADKPVPAIAPATRFFRNRPLLDEVFALLQGSGHASWRLFCHACSTGEEPYSFAMYNLLGPRLDLRITAADYNQDLLDQAMAARYDWLTIWRDNSTYLTRRERRLMRLVWLNCEMRPKVRAAIDQWLRLDYTDAANQFETRHAADIVLCNSSLLYHPVEVQAQVLDRLCRQAADILVVTGVDNVVLESVLTRHGFVPHRGHWEAIYDGCRLRRRALDGAFTTPTTPFLSDSNRAKEHYFRYAIFLRVAGRLAKALGNPNESHR